MDVHTDVIIENVQEFDTESHSLVGYWAQYASVPMMDDGTIYWYQKGKANYLQKVCDRLELDTGLNFERTDIRSEAEIISKRRRRFDPELNLGPFTRGYAQYRGTEQRWHVVVKRGVPNIRSTIVHELGHALGLDHPQDHSEETDTIMSYNRDRSSRYFYPKDIDYLTGLYNY